MLSGGRLRLGVGIGWNHVEYEALGENFHNRGRRVEEQIALLRELWTKELVDFDGKYHTVHQAGIRPMPVQRPIPIWMGGMAEPVLKRAARIADGWFPQFQPGPAGERRRSSGCAAICGTPAAGRATSASRARISLFNTPPDEWGAALEGWRGLGRVARVVQHHERKAGLTAGAHRRHSTLQGIRRLAPSDETLCRPRS